MRYLILALLEVLQSVMALWPEPRSIEAGVTAIWLKKEVRCVHRRTHPRKWSEGLEQTALFSPHSLSKTIESPADLLTVAFERFRSRVTSKSFVPHKFHPRRAGFEPSIENKTYIEEVSVEEENPRPNVSVEAYAIHISLDGKCTINSASSLGALRALDSLAQLFYVHTLTSSEAYTPYAPVSIRDAPYFEHRGLNLDVARNWIPPEDVRRTIEAMGFCKFNRLHVHVTDSQSWPLEIPALPRLAQEGAYREDQVWSVKELADLQRFGLYAGVEVYLEIDTPGHTGSIVHGYPDLITAYNKRPWGKYSQEPPSGQLKLNSPDVSSFIEDLLHDLLPRVLPFTTRFHLGGDEFNKEVYALDPGVKSSSKEVIRPYLQSFVGHMVSLVEAHHLTPHVWEDLLLEWDIDLPKHTILQSWRPGGLAKVADRGYRDWYLDQGFGTFLDPDPQNPATPIKPPYPSWASPHKNWRQVLAYDPLKEIPEDKQHLVLGGEVHLWGELLDSVNLDFMLWPRAAAAAEMMWKGKGEVSELSTRRLAEMRERLVAMGIRSEVVQMEWALRNQGECVL